MRTGTRHRRSAFAVTAVLVFGAASLPSSPAAARLTPAEAAIVAAAEAAAAAQQAHSVTNQVLADAEALEAVWQGGQSELDRLNAEADRFEQTADAVAGTTAKIKSGAGLADLHAVEEAVFTARGLLAGRLRGVAVGRLRTPDLVNELRREAARLRELVAGVASGLGVRPEIDAARSAAEATRAVLDQRIGELAVVVGAIAGVAPDGLRAAWLGIGDQRRTALVFALGQIGKPYRFASQGPRAFDCSGLTTAAWRAGGRRLTPYSFAQKAETLAVAPQDMLAGDLVFWDRRRAPNVEGPPGHVAMFLGSDGLVVEASGAGAVRVNAFKTSYLAGYGHVELPGEMWAPTAPDPRIVPRP